MGYASYLEDINRRLDEGLASARSRRNAPTGPVVVQLADKKFLLYLEALIATASREINGWIAFGLLRQMTIWISLRRLLAYEWNLHT
jgi:hypothetical protein